MPRGIAVFLVAGLAVFVGLLITWSRTPRTEPPGIDVEGFWKKQFGPLYPERESELMEAYRVLFTLRSMLDLYAGWSGEMPTSWSALRADFPMAVDWAALGQVFGVPVQLVDAPSQEVGEIWLGMWEWPGTPMWTLYLAAPARVVLRMPITSSRVVERQQRPPQPAAEGGLQFFSIFYDERDWVASLSWEDRAWYLTCTLLVRLPEEHFFASRGYLFYYPPFVAQAVPVEWETPEELIYQSFFIGEVLRNPYTGEDLRASLSREPAPRSIVWRALEVQPEGRWWRFGCLDGEGGLLNVAQVGYSLATEGVKIRLAASYPRDLWAYGLLKNLLPALPSDKG